MYFFFTLFFSFQVRNYINHEVNIKATMPVWVSAYRTAIIMELFILQLLPKRDSNMQSEK